MAIPATDLDRTDVAVRDVAELYEPVAEEAAMLEVERVQCLGDGGETGPLHERGDTGTRFMGQDPVHLHDGPVLGRRGK